MTPAVPDEDLLLDVQALADAGGNRSAAARARKLPRKTFTSRLRQAEARGLLSLSLLADGRVGEVVRKVLPLPAEGEVQRYIVTSAQNNTLPHPAWENLKAYAEWLDALPGAACRFIVGSFSYALDAYGAKNVKRGKASDDEDELWYAPELVPFLLDEPVQLAPGLVWCGEMNILPTAKHPLSGLETYNGRLSNIFPHAKIQMESIASMPHEATKFNYSTGTVTQRNYIQKKAGILAEQQHDYGGLLVEVNSRGDWFVRQLHIDSKGHVYDVGPSEGDTDGAPAVRIVDRKVLRDAHVEAITWGDIHEAEMEAWIRRLGWGVGEMLDELRPRVQVLHDIFSQRARGHHDIKNVHVQYAKMVAGTDSVEGEVETCAGFLREAAREWCDSVVIPSNHDRHLDRWLTDEDPRKDLKNMRYHLHLNGVVLAGLEAGKPVNVLEAALREKGVPDSVRFLPDDESLVLAGIEQGLHGDRGPGGSKGSTRGLARLGRPVTKGHDHTAAIRERVYSIGACSLRFAYMHGPSAHSVSHVVTFRNGARQVITMWKGRWRA